MAKDTSMSRGAIQNALFSGGQVGGMSSSVNVKDASEAGILKFLEYAWNCVGTVTTQKRYELIDKYYAMEDSRDSQDQVTRKLNRLGDKKKLADSRIPLVQTQVETATSYMQETFLTGYPIFGVAANKTFQAEAQMLEAQLAENQVTANWAGNLLKCYRDGMKYNIMHAKVHWDTIVVPQVANAAQLDATATKQSDLIWAGNKIEHLDVYNTFIDKRVNPATAHIDGEFAYHNEVITRMALMKFISKLKDSGVRLRNVADVLRSTNNVREATKYNVPVVNPSVTPSGYLNAAGQVNWLSWMSGQDAAQSQYAAMYTRTFLYARIIPAEFRLHSDRPNDVQIWEFCIINGSHILYAQPLSNYHDYLPIITGVPHDDALRYQTKSLANNAMGFQDQAAVMWNIHLEAQRRNVTDRCLYDPSMIDPAQMNNPNPSAKIPIKANALGRKLGEAVYQFPFHDSTQNLPQEAQQMVQFANMMNGQNQASQGQFVKGNKTMTEYNDVMSNSTFRNRMFALSIENGFHAAVKQILLTNTLQFQKAQDFIIASGLTDAGQPLSFNPVKVRNANLAFKLSDGNIPKSKILGTDAMAGAMNTLATVPAIGASYDVGDIFGYLMDMQNANISQFRKPQGQVMFEQAQQSWQQACMQIAKSGSDKFPPQPKPTDYGLNADGSPVNQSQQPTDQVGANQAAISSSMNSAS